MTTSRPRHLLRLGDLDDALLADVLELSSHIQRRSSRDDLAGRTIGSLFFRRSLRTRASFEAAVHRLGGNIVNLTAMSDIWELESREGVLMDGVAPEHVCDAAAVLSRYTDALAIRPRPDGNSWEVDRKDEALRTWARYATVPVINMESALYHPLQALADLVTLRSVLGKNLAGKELAITWVRSPQPSSPSVVHSLLHGALRFGMRVRLSHPDGYELDEGVLADAEEIRARGGGELVHLSSMEECVEGARVVYARSWGSREFYGNPALEATRAASYKGWRIDEKLLSSGNDAHLMHPMPVRRNVEVSDEVLDGERSLLYDQAANRMTSQMALLSHLLRDN
ncbi:MAG: N-acetylornithine carbamoyltransferase [Planctomycetota bacterium]|jgi:N-acetylornithine carbamoyltransferase